MVQCKILPSKRRKSHFRGSRFQNFLGGACPRTPLQARAFGARRRLQFEHQSLKRLDPPLLICGVNMQSSFVRSYLYKPHSVQNMRTAVSVLFIEYERLKSVHRLVLIEYGQKAYSCFVFIDCF